MCASPDEDSGLSGALWPVNLTNGARFAGNSLFSLNQQTRSRVVHEFVFTAAKPSCDRVRRDPAAVRPQLPVLTRDVASGLTKTLVIAVENAAVSP
jgi:hypothetical protein